MKTIKLFDDTYKVPYNKLGKFFYMYYIYRDMYNNHLPPLLHFTRNLVIGSEWTISDNLRRKLNGKD